MLHLQWYAYEEMGPFRFAVFISGGLPLAALRSIGVPVAEEAEELIRESLIRREQGLEPAPAHLSNARRALFNSDDCFGLNLNRIPLELKIRIPTAHVWGTMDPLFPTSIHLAGLCDPYIRKVYNHPGSRAVPIDADGSDELVQLVQWCVDRANWPGQSELRCED
jgi:hypothetical protein